MCRLGRIDDLTRIGEHGDGGQRDRQDLAVAVGDRRALSERGGLRRGFRRGEQRLDRPFGSMRRERLEDGRIGQLADHREEQQTEAERRIDEPVPRLLECAALLQVRLRDPHRLHARHGVRARRTDALSGRAARRGIGGRSAAHGLASSGIGDPLRGADRHRPRRRQRGTPAPSRARSRPSASARARTPGSAERGCSATDTGRATIGVGCTG